MSGTPPGNPLSRGDKRSASRPGLSSAAYLTALTEEGGLEPALAECAAVSVLNALLRHLELDDNLEPQGHLMSKLLEFLPAHEAAKDTPAPIEDQEALISVVARELLLEPAQVEPLVRTLFQNLREFLSEGECHEVERSLSWDLQHLWRRTQ